VPGSCRLLRLPDDLLRSTACFLSLSQLCVSARCCHRWRICVESTRAVQTWRRVAATSASSNVAELDELCRAASSLALSRHANLAAPGILEQQRRWLRGNGLAEEALSGVCAPLLRLMESAEVLSVVHTPALDGGQAGDARIRVQCAAATTSAVSSSSDPAQSVDLYISWLVGVQRHKCMQSDYSISWISPVGYSSAASLPSAVRKRTLLSCCVYSNLREGDLQLDARDFAAWLRERGMLCGALDLRVLQLSACMRFFFSLALVRSGHMWPEPRREQCVQACGEAGEMDAEMQGFKLAFEDS